MFQDKLNDQEIIREAKAEKLKQQNKYPFSIEKVTNNISIKNIVEKYKNTDKDELKEKNLIFTCCGRVMLIRQTFFVISEEHNQIQAYINLKESEPTLIEYFEKYLDIGDIVKISGKLFFTQKNELTLRINELQIISKCLTPLPEKYFGIKDPELLVRNRVASTITNFNIFNIFVIRSKIIFEIRNFLNSLDYLEFETSIFQNASSGATAKPFITHYNALNRNFYLRVAPELSLKKIITAGYNKIFEIGKSFRNEGIDSTHNPEFTSIEIYTAYDGLQETIELTESIFKHISSVLKKTNFDWYGNNIDMKFPFKKKSLSELVEEKIGINFYNNPPSLEEALKICEKYHINLLIHEKTIGHILHKLFEELVENTLIEPIFVCHYHQDVSPFAKTDPNNKDFTLRFELFIGGKEFANGFAELNDPLEQKRRFEMQIKEKEQGNSETAEIDMDYIKSLKYGLPPTGGIGIGIDRLIMLFTENSSIKDVIFFPQLKT